MAEKPVRRLLYRPAAAFRSSGAFGFTMFSTMVGLGLMLVWVVALALPLPPLVKYFGLPLLLLMVFAPLVVSWHNRSAWELAIGQVSVAGQRKRGESLLRSGPFTMIPTSTTTGTVGNRRNLRLLSWRRVAAVRSDQARIAELLHAGAEGLAAGRGVERTGHP